ncbi:MAG: hypothetical protein DBX58_05740 [Clostridiales bacterium]|nr:MAG: hypothetical protein DBX58_05740 [Clostridiales bacterium]HJA30398.1 hypothetical protein [Candidatus Eisenbergiella pullicola]
MSDGASIGEKRNGRKRRWPLLLALVLEAVICLSWFISSQDDFRYGIGYDVSPLKMKRVSVINRSGERDSYDISEDQGLYEVRITYENLSGVTGEFSSGPDFFAGEDEYYLYEASPVTGDDLAYEVRYTQKIPAGCTGTFSWFLAVERGMETIRIEERAQRLFGEKQSIALTLPGGDGARQEWTAQE